MSRDIRKGGVKREIRKKKRDGMIETVEGH